MRKVLVVGATSAIAEATARLRETMTADPAEFRHGPGRVAFETIWTLERYDALQRILAEVPVTWRFFVKQRVFAALKSAGPAADVFAAYAKLRHEFADLPPAVRTAAGND